MSQAGRFKAAAEDGWARMLKLFRDAGVTPGAKA
jgi:hypothetical protein